jgi:valyl-tRNA synthetase
MLHPLMPFITEELWNANRRPYELIVAKWPDPEAQVDPYAKAELEWLIRLISDVRSARVELNVPPGERLIAYIEEPEPTVEGRLDKYDHTLIRIAKISWEPVYGRREGPTLRVNAGTRELVMSLAGVIDAEAERSRLTKGAAAAEKERDSLAARLANPQFAERAKPEAVEKARADHEAKVAEAKRLRAALERLG